MPNVRRHLSSRLGFVNTSTSPKSKCLRLRFLAKYRPPVMLRDMHFKFMSNKVWADYVCTFTSDEGYTLRNLFVLDREGYKLLRGVIETDGPIEPVIDWLLDHFPLLAPDITEYVEAPRPT